MSEPITQAHAKGVIRYSNSQAKAITKECIEGAMIQLLERKDMEKITISELAKRAGVSRTAFYAHYASKEDVIRSALNEIIRRIEHTIIGDPRTESFWLGIFTRSAESIGTLRLLLKAGLGPDTLQAVIDHRLAAAPEDTLSRYRELTWIGAIYCILSHWVVSEQPEAPEVMAKLCVQIVEFQY